VLVAPFKTKRLVLSHFEASDVGALFSFMSDGPAMKHTYVAPSLEHCLARLSAYEGMRKSLGFAPWVVRTQQEGSIVGWGGLSIDPDEPDWGLEVSYAFSPGSWGKGFGTELVQASLGYAFGILQAPEVHAFAKPQNTASVRVLEKNGFTLLRYEPVLNRNHYLVALASAA
jgi:[ribosomal protein S5]-alanine N-acetyltransferase